MYNEWVIFFFSFKNIKKKLDVNFYKYFNVNPRGSKSRGSQGSKGLEGYPRPLNKGYDNKNFQKKLWVGKMLNFIEYRISNLIWS
jgi:hypothetical protein